jgi:hypothetical protein
LWRFLKVIVSDSETVNDRRIRSRKSGGAAADTGATGKDRPMPVGLND